MLELTGCPIVSVQVWGAVSSRGCLAHSLFNEVSEAFQKAFLPHLVGVLAGGRWRSLSTCPLYLPLIAQEGVSLLCLGTAKGFLPSAGTMPRYRYRYGAIFGQIVLFLPSYDQHFSFSFLIPGSWIFRLPVGYNSWHWAERCLISGDCTD